MVSTPPHQGAKLFYAHPSCPGIVKCAVCGEVFVVGSYVRALKVVLSAQGLPTKWINTPEGERASRRAHAQRHVERCEATYAADGFFRLHVEPARAPAARDFGFITC